MKSLLVILALLVAVPCHAEFSVDQRSLLHVGYSAVFGAAIDTVAYHGIHQWDKSTRLLAATVLGSVPGVVKETMIDEYVDYGDLAFNPVGAFLGGYASEVVNERYFGPSRHDIYVLITNNSITIAGTW